MLLIQKTFESGQLFLGCKLSLGFHGLFAQLFPFCVGQLGAVGAQYLLLVCDEALTHQILPAVGPIAVEALVVPMPTIERNELRTTDACDGFVALGASLGEQLPEAVCTVGFVVTRRELLPDQIVLAVGAAEAVSVVGLVSVEDPTRHYGLAACLALGGEEVVEALDAVGLVVFRHERIAPNHGRTVCALETLLVPLLPIPL